MEVLKEGSSESETYYLKSTDTNYTISKNIIPNTKYQILFKCSYIDPETKEEVFDTIDDISITTKLPSVSIKVTNIDFDNITYLISTDNNFNISGALLTLYINDVKYKDYDLVFDKDYESFIEIPEIDSSVDDDKEIIMELRLTNIKFGDTVIEGLSARTKFKY